MSPLINITSPAFMWQSASNGYSAQLSPLVGLPGANQCYQPVQQRGSFTICVLAGVTRRTGYNTRSPQGPGISPAVRSPRQGSALRPAQAQAGGLRPCQPRRPRLPLRPEAAMGPRGAGGGAGPAPRARRACLPSAMRRGRAGPARPFPRAAAAPPAPSRAGAPERPPLSAGRFRVGSPGRTRPRGPGAGAAGSRGAEREATRRCACVGAARTDRSPASGRSRAAGSTPA